jgi:YVTN family beta-propeller protein
MFPRSRCLLRQLSRAGAILTTLVATTAFAAGPKAYVGNFKDNSVSVIDTDAGKVVATVPVGTGPHGMAVSPDGRNVYVSGDLASTVSVIDTTSDRVAQTIEVGKAPHGLAMKSDGKILLVAVFGEDRVAFVDTSTRAVIGTVAVAKPHTIAIRPDDKVAYIASQEPGRFGLAIVDLETRAVVRNRPLDKTPRDVEFGYDGEALYYTQAGVNAIQVLDPASDKVVAEISTGASPHIAGYYRGTTVGVAVVQGPGELLLFKPANNAAVRSVAVGKQPHWVATAGDGKKAYVTNEGSNDVTVVDLANGQTTTIAVGNAPRKVVVQRGAASAGKGM